jgi:hypothetical protein
MKSQTLRCLLVIVSATALLALAWVFTGQQARAGDPALTAAMTTTGMVYAQEEEKPEGKDVQVEFVGSKKCKMCHSKLYKSWEETAHAKAFDPLKPGEAKEAKEKAKLDPAKDYTKDKECLACHVVGLGQPGGFEFKDDAAEMEKMIATLGHVGCESCHGAGGGYIDFHKEIQKEKKEYTLADMKEHGCVNPDEAACKQCHNEKSPTFESFDYTEAVKTGIHEKPGLKYRKSE